MRLRIKFGWVRNAGAEDRPSIAVRQLTAQDPDFPDLRPASGSQTSSAPPSRCDPPAPLLGQQLLNLLGFHARG